MQNEQELNIISKFNELKCKQSKVKRALRDKKYRDNKKEKLKMALKRTKTDLEIIETESDYTYRVDSDVFCFVQSPIMKQVINELEQLQSEAEDVSSIGSDLLAVLRRNKLLLPLKTSILEMTARKATLTALKLNLERSVQQIGPTLDTATHDDQIRFYENKIKIALISKSLDPVVNAVRLAQEKEIIDIVNPSTVIATATTTTTPAITATTTTTTPASSSWFGR